MQESTVKAVRLKTVAAQVRTALEADDNISPSDILAAVKSAFKQSGADARIVEALNQKLPDPEAPVKPAAARAAVQAALSEGPADFDTAGSIRRALEVVIKAHADHDLVALDVATAVKTGIMMADIPEPKQALRPLAASIVEARNSGAAQPEILAAMHEGLSALEGRHARLMDKPAATREKGWGGVVRDASAGKTGQGWGDRGATG